MNKIEMLLRIGLLIMGVLGVTNALCARVAHKRLELNRKRKLAHDKLMYIRDYIV